MSRRTVLRAAIAGGALATAVSAVVQGAPASERASVAARADRVRTPAHRRPGWTEGEIGRSVEGRAILRWDSEPTRRRRHVAIICGTHGDERAMEQLAEGFGRIDAPADMHLTIVPHLNPDGWAAGTRHNAANVDLNRNFPWGWRRGEFGGPVAGSEPETRAAMRFLRTRTAGSRHLGPPAARLRRSDRRLPAALRRHLVGLRERPGATQPAAVGRRRDVDGGRTRVALDADRGRRYASRLRSGSNSTSMRCRPWCSPSRRTERTTPTPTDLANTQHLEIRSGPPRRGRILKQLAPMVLVMYVAVVWSCLSLLTLVGLEPASQSSSDKVSPADDSSSGRRRVRRRPVAEAAAWEPPGRSAHPSGLSGRTGGPE